MTAWAQLDDERGQNAGQSVGAVQVLAGLGAACSNGADSGALRTSVQRQVVIGLFRDLRGITMATNSRRNYGEPLSISPLHLRWPEGSNQECMHHCVRTKGVFSS